MCMSMPLPHPSALNLNPPLTHICMRAQANQRRMEEQAGPLDVHEHAAAPPVDPIYEQEGIVFYKNLLGPGQNMSHVAGADVEAQVRGRGVVRWQDGWLADAVA